MWLKNQGDGFKYPVDSEITGRAYYESHGEILKLMANGDAGGVMASWASRQALAQTPGLVQRPGKLATLNAKPSAVAGATTIEKATAYKYASTYNNCYDFGTEKAEPAANAPNPILAAL